jgi:hypothetical protein
MKKAQLIANLNECVRIHEALVPMCSKHLSNNAFFSGFTLQEQKIITDILDQLKNDSKRHRMIFEALVRTVEKSEQDDY